MSDDLEDALKSAVTLALAEPDSGTAAAAIEVVGAALRREDDPEVAALAIVGLLAATVTHAGRATRKNPAALWRFVLRRMAAAEAGLR